MGIRDNKTAEQLYDGIALMHRNLKDGAGTSPTEDSPARLGYSYVPPVAVELKNATWLTSHSTST